jgi:hypothetical protein
MTEAEWLAATDPMPMLLRVSREGAGERKIRLFALSCCRAVEYLLGADDVKRCRAASAMLENRIEGAASERELQTALSDMVGEVMDAAHSIHHPGEANLYAISHAATTLECVRRGEWAGLTERACHAIASDALSRSGNHTLERISALWRPGNRLSEVEWRRDEAAVRGLPEYVSALGIEQRNQANLLRDIFGNPFRPATFDPAWRTPTVVALARGMYESRDFGAMPILADALQDAGCDNEEVLSHCRGPGPHVRGCWVVDLVLGKG